MPAGRRPQSPAAGDARQPLGVCRPDAVLEKKRPGGGRAPATKRPPWGRGKRNSTGCHHPPSPPLRRNGGRALGGSEAPHLDGDTAQHLGGGRPDAGTRRGARLRLAGRRPLDGQSTGPQPPHPHPYMYPFRGSTPTSPRTPRKGVHPHTERACGRGRGCCNKTATRRRLTRLTHALAALPSAPSACATPVSRGLWQRPRGSAAAARRCQIQQRGGGRGPSRRQPRRRPPSLHTPPTAKVAPDRCTVGGGGGASSRDPPRPPPRSRRLHPCRQRANAVPPRDRCAPARERVAGGRGAMALGGTRRRLWIPHLGGGRRGEPGRPAPFTKIGDWEQPPSGKGNDNRPVELLTFLKWCAASATDPLPSPFWAWASTSNVSRAVNLSCLQVGVSAQTA